MKLEYDPRVVNTSGVMQTSKATIAQSRKAFDFFANQTYSNKFNAIVRELAANAIDAMVSAQNPNPIDVHLPDDLDPYFRVRDQGIGMSHEFCMGDFMRYTDGSTKDHDDNAIGGFGIGSKSPFAYTDQFTLRSVFNGVCSVYVVFKDEDGIPSISLLTQTPTSEANGVEFQLPVASDDFYLFEAAAQRELRYFTPTPRLHGADLQAPQYVQSGEGWALEGYVKGSPRVVMGGVSYALNQSELSYDFKYTSGDQFVLEMPVVIFAPIGTFPVTLSREGLLYNDQTTELLEDLLTQVALELRDSVQGRYDSHVSYWDACIAYAKDLEALPHGFANMLRSAKLQWQGKQLETYHYEKAGIDLHKVEFARKKRGGRGNMRPIRWGDCSVKAREDIVFIHVDDPTVRNIRQRVQLYFDTHHPEEDTVILTREDLSTHPIFSGAPTPLKLSELPEPPKKPRVTTSKWLRPEVRMFQLGYDAQRGQSRQPSNWRAVSEIEYAHQPSEGILVVMDSFSVPEGFWDKYATDLIAKDDIYFVNKGDAHKLKSFTSFDDAFSERLIEAISAVPTMAQHLALRQSALSDLIGYIEREPELFKTPRANTPLAKIKQLIDDYPDYDHRIADFVAPQLPPRLNPEKLLARFESMQWKLNTLMTTGLRHSEDGRRLLKEFI
jgi:hypothetical protein